jgi:hypothetical protein
MSQIASSTFLSTAKGRRKARVRLRTMMPLIPLGRSNGIIKRKGLQKCLDCKHTTEIRVLFGAKSKAWQPIGEKYNHQPGCISEGKF